MFMVATEIVAALVQQKQNQNNGYLCQHQTAAIAITQ
jgi:hypothetical protein